MHAHLYSLEMAQGVGITLFIDKVVTSREDTTNKGVGDQDAT